MQRGIKKVKQGSMSVLVNSRSKETTWRLNYGAGLNQSEYNTAMHLLKGTVPRLPRNPQT